MAIPTILLIAAPLSLPETPEELKETGNLTLQAFPDVLKEVWQGFLNSLLTIWEWIKTFFNSYINPFLQNIWQNIWQERKKIVSQELEKEKQTTFQEIKTILSKFPKSLWEKAKGLIK